MLRSKNVAKGSIQQWFQAFDADRTGRISADEMRKMLSSITNAPVQQSDVHELMAAFDANADGGICFSEFVNLVWDKDHFWILPCFSGFRLLLKAG